MITGLLEEYGKSKYVCMLIFFSSRDTGETRIYYVWSDNVSIMQGSDTNGIIREVFRSFLHNYQEQLKMIKGSDFVFESVDLIDYKLHRVCLNRGGSYIKSPEWLENKKAIINPKNKNDGECLRWSIISALNHMKNYEKKSVKTYLKKLNMKIKIFHHIKGTGKILNEIMNQLLLMSYLHLKMVKK